MLLFERDDQSVVCVKAEPGVDVDVGFEEAAHVDAAVQRDAAGAERDVLASCEEVVDVQLVAVVGVKVEGHAAGWVVVVVGARVERAVDEDRCDGDCDV